MTDQIQDSITFDGRQWAIEKCKEDQIYIPSNHELGFETNSAETNNWSSRVNHFLVYRNKLILFKIEVNLPEEARSTLPLGARKEVHRRFGELSLMGKRLLYESTYFVFDNLEIEYTGKIEACYPYFDSWNIPQPIQDEDLEIEQFAILYFENGMLIDVT